MKISVFISLLMTVHFTPFGQQVVEDSIYFSHDASYRNYKVWLPQDYDADKTCQTIYCFDASLLFNLVTAQVEFYSDPFIAKMPPSIVVGIYFNQRNDDMGIIWDESRLNETGEAFKKMIVKELIPVIEQRYSVSDYRSVIGHSNSSTFAQFFLWDDEPCFQGYLTMSQYSLEKDSMRFAGLLPDLDRTMDFVYTTGKLDAPYRVESGYRLEKWLDQTKSDLFETKHLVTEGDHLTMVSRGLPEALEVLYQDYGRLFSADSIWQDEGGVQNPLAYMDSLVASRGLKYGVESTYTMDDLNALFDLFILKKDSVGVRQATYKYAEMFNDSSEYFYEAQCLEMMGANHAAEKVYLKHLDFFCCPGYWSYIRLVWLYAYDLKQPESAVEWCLNGYADLKDINILNELVKITETFPDYSAEVIQQLKEIQKTEASKELGNLIEKPGSK